MIIRKVLVDKHVLAKFRRRAFKAYPLEHLEQIWGTIKGQTVHICALEPIDFEEQKRASIEATYDVPCGSEVDKLIMLGSIHTHPNDDTTPSDEDLGDATHEKEYIWGICAINIRKERKFTSWAFFNRRGKPLELTIGE